MFYVTDLLCIYSMWQWWEKSDWTGYKELGMQLLFVMETFFFEMEHSIPLTGSANILATWKFTSPGSTLGHTCPRSR
jgi:hypothetical protein